MPFDAETGKRVAWNKGLAGPPQSQETRDKKATTMRKHWAEQRECRVAANRRGAAKRLAVNGTSYAGVHQRLNLRERGECCAGEVGMNECEAEAREWALRHEVRGMV